MRNFDPGVAIVIEPFRAKAFPVIKDLVVDRNAFDQIASAGGYVSQNCGSAPEANALPVPKEDAVFDGNSADVDETSRDASKEDTANAEAKQDGKSNAKDSATKENDQATQDSDDSVKDQQATDDQKAAAAS